MLLGLSTYAIDNSQVVVQTTNDESTDASAQAFMQAFYPPYMLGNQTTSLLTSTQVLADGSYVDYPLNNYQYSYVQTFSALDPDSLFLSGADNCVAWDIGAAAYYNSGAFANTSSETQYIYSLIGPEILSGVLSEAGWTYANAYAIYDYVSYQYNHNVTLNKLLSQNSSAGILEALYSYASLMEYNLNGDQSFSGLTEGDRILTIAGQTLAAEIARLLYMNIATDGNNFKMSLIVGDYGPMMSLFSLMDLPSKNPAFEAIPSFGSALVFELFTWDNGTEAGYPDADELMVRFFYYNASANGTTASPNFESYSLFSRGPSLLDMYWPDFETEMGSIMMGDPGAWCAACASTSIWCPYYYNNSCSTTSAAHKDRVSPAVAGVIGAAVTLAFAFLAVAAAMLCCGMRVQRRGGAAAAPLFARRRTSASLGGFKGSAKLASDVDVSLSKNGAPVAGAAVLAAGADDGAKKGHERVGSWEMRDGPAAAADKAVEEGRFSSLAGSTVAARSSGAPSEERPSFEADDDIGLSTPARAREGF